MNDKMTSFDESKDGSEIMRRGERLPRRKRKPMSKKTKTSIAAAVVGVVVIVVAVSALHGILTVSSSDYEAAFEKLSDVSDSTDFNGWVSAERLEDYSASDIDSFDEDINDDIKDGQSSINALGASKAIGHDNLAKNKYNRLKTAYSKLSHQAEKTLDTAKEIQPVLSAIGNRTINSSTANQSAIDYYTKVKKAADDNDSDDSTIKGAMNDISEASSTFIDYYTKKKNNQSTDGIDTSSATNKFNNAIDELDKALGSESYNRRISEYNSAYNNLSDYLARKYYEN